MIKNALNQLHGPVRVSTSTALEEGADRSPLATRAGNLNCILSVMLSLYQCHITYRPLPNGDLLGHELVAAWLW